MDSIRERVCKRVKELRKLAGLTQEQLAAKADLSVDGIRKIETVRTTPTLETLEKIGQALALSLSELLTFESSTPENAQRQELEQIHLYLATRDVKEIRIAKKVVEAVIKGLENQ